MPSASSDGLTTSPSGLRNNQETRYRADLRDSPAGQQRCCTQRAKVNADQEVWIKQQVLTAIRAARAVEKACWVRADQPVLDCAIDGIANGAAIEIIHSLDMEPEYTNLRKYLPGVLE
jgi:hypothetical protein